MNAFERRQLIKARVIDVKVAKTALEQSRRERAEAAKQLRKAMAAQTDAASWGEQTSYSRQSHG